MALAGAVVVVVAVARDRPDSGSSPAASTATSRSSTIAWAGDSLWVTSPDDDQVVRVAPSGLDVVQRSRVPGEPRELTVLGDRVVVTASQSTRLAVIDRRGGEGASPPDLVELPCGGSRSVVTVPSGVAGARSDLALVTCPDDDVLAAVDLGRGRTVGTVALAGRPSGIVRDGRTLTVSTARDGRLHAFSIADLVDAVGSGAPVDGGFGTLSVEATSSRRVWADDGRTASSLASLDTGPRGPLGVYQVVDNQRELTRAEIEAGSTYGTPSEGRARLEPALAGACGARFASVTDEARRLSGPVALAASPEGDLVWVVGEFSHSVSVVRCTGAASGQRSTTVAAFDVGEGARGIVLSADGQTAYVDVGFDHEVAELVLPAGATAADGGDPIERLEPARVGRREAEVRHLSARAEEGRRMFNDATDTHLTPFGVVACGSCHPGAGEDGLSWRIERSDPTTKAIERKVRRTPPAWQVDAAEKPLHWNGEFTSADDLALGTVQDLLGGDGLLVDTSSLVAYMAEVAPPPPRPVRDGAGGSRDESERTFTRVGCASCHAGERGTDGKLHDVLTPSSVRDAALEAVVTPRLTGVRSRAPYGHDGRAGDLRSLLEVHGDGAGGAFELSEAELAAVLAYLDSR